MTNNAKILFIVNMDENNKAGLFNATHNRIKYLTKYIDDYAVYNIREYDSLLLSLVKRMLKKKSEKKGRVSFVYEGIVYKNLYIKRTLLNTLMFKIGCDFFLLMPALLRIAKEIKSFNLINTHWAYPHGKIAYYLKKFFKIPYVLTSHGSDIHSNPYINNKLKKNTLKALNFSDFNFFVSNGLHQQAKKLGYIKNNFCVLYNGVDLELFKSINPSEKNKYKSLYNVKGKVIGFVGNLVAVKRADKLPMIFYEIKKQYRGLVTFLVIGDGELRQEIENKMLQLGINVVFLGRVSQKELPPIMSILDIIVLPSREEGLGNVLLEAIACGTVPVGTNVGGIPEAIGDNYLLVDDGPFFERDIAEKVVNLLRFGYKMDYLMKRTKNNFSLEKIGLKEWEICNEILSNNNKKK